MRAAEIGVGVVAAIVLGLGALGACGAKQRGEPAGPPVRPDTVAEARGARLFDQHCYPCHPGGEAGLGPALNDKPLPAFAIQLQIREGIGAMPAFDHDHLTDDEVDAIVAYVEELRASPSTFAERDPRREAGRWE